MNLDVTRFASILVLGGLALLPSACKDAPPAAGDGKTAGPAAAATATAKPAAAEPKKDGVASCDTIKGEMLCREWGYKNIEAVGNDSLKKTCDGLQGAFATTACPADKRVGSCSSPEGKKIYYSGGKFSLSAADAEKNCQGTAGTWKAGS